MQDNNKSKTGNELSQLPIRLYTHNIRYATTHPFKNELPWSKRAPLIIRSIRFHSLHNPESLICLQEVLLNQLLDILEGLGPEWAHIGVGRDDGQSVLALNTHLDDQGTQSRLESAKIIVAHVATQQGQYQLNQQQRQQQQEPLCKLPILLAGDFNSTPDEEAYLLLATENSPLLDLKTAVGKSDWYGHENTFTGFECRPVDQKRIDFLFLSKDCWHVQRYGVLETKFEDGIFSSDHRPVVGDVALPL
ncbi:hypothetical protein BGZ82_002407 [Podila clonocystis]|nr:hypothetical protein BGZ82_002407 [Podila clonocystis]